MGKSVAIDVIPYVSCPTMKQHDLGPIYKSLEASTKKLEALTRRVKAERGSIGAVAVYGGQRHTEPPGLPQGGLQMMLGCLNSSPALEGIGKASSLPDFDGSSSRSFVSWLYEVKCCFKKQCLSDSRKCELVVSCLKGAALLWYNTLKFSRRMKGKGMIHSWPKLELHMKRKYLPSCAMADLKTTLETLKQNLVSIKGDTKPFGKPQPLSKESIESRPQNVQPYHEPKPEILEQIDLGIVCSLGKVNCVSGSYTVGHLDSLEPKSMEVLSYGEKDVNLVPLPFIEEEQSDITLVQVHGAKQENDAVVQGFVLSTYMSPLDIYINKRLQQPLSLKMDQFLTLLDGQRCWSSRKNKQGGCSYLVSCSKAQIQTYCISFCPEFKTYCLGGIACALTTPHFHFYMLIRLQVSLVHLGTISYMLVKESKHMNANMFELFWSNELNHFGEFRGLKYLPWVFYMLLSRTFIAKMLILIHSRWKLICDRKMDQIRNCCPGLKFLCFKMSNVPNICEELLGLFGTSNTSSLHDVDGVLAHLVMFMLRLMHKDRNSLLVALVRSCTDDNSHLSLYFIDHNLHKSSHYIVECKTRLKPPWSLRGINLLGLEAHIHILESEHSELYTRKGNKAKGARLKLIFMSIMCIPGHSGLETSTFELEASLILRRKVSVMVFDPGGSKSQSHLEVIKIFTQPPTLNIQDLRPNPFQPREGAAGARGKGPSFFIPKKQSMELLQRNAHNEYYSEEDNEFLHHIQKYQEDMPDFEASYLEFYSCKSFDSCVIGILKMLNSYEIWKRTKGYFISREMQLPNEPGRSEIIKQSQSFWSDLNCSYLEFYLLKDCVLYMYEILKMPTFQWSWNQQDLMCRFPTIRPQRLS